MNTDLRTATKALEKKLNTAVTEVFNQFRSLLADAEEVGQSEARSQITAKLGMSEQPKAKKRGRPASLSKKTQGVGGRVGLPPGIRKCRIWTAVDSKGPKYAFLCKEVHDHFYTGRTPEEAKRLVQEVLAARAAGAPVHAMDPGPGPRASQVPASSEVTTDAASQEMVGTGSDQVPEGTSSDWFPLGEPARAGATPLL